MGSCAKYLRKVQQMDLWNSKIDNVMFISKPFRFSLNFSLSLSSLLHQTMGNFLHSQQRKRSKEGLKESERDRKKLSVEFTKKKTRNTLHIIGETHISTLAPPFSKMLSSQI